MRRLLIALTAVAALIGTPALAADMALKAPPPPPPYTWTGFYGGVQLGGEWANDTWNAQCFGGNCPGNFLPPTGEMFTPDGSSPANLSGASVRGGIYAGYNWQVRPAWVVGGEADFAWANASSTVPGLVGCSVIPQSCVPGHVTTTLGNDSSSIRSDWDGSVRARLGFVPSPAVLLYATGGVAFQRFDAAENCGSTLFGGGGAWCLALRSQTDSTTLVGWTAGGGIDWRLAGNWIARVEYRYEGFGNWQTSFFANSPTAGQAANVDFNSASLRLGTNILTLGLAYKFF